MQKFGKKLRHELKYYLHRHEVAGLRDRVRHLLPLDSHSVSAEGYHIRSLYFDNMHESALYDKINGVFQRKKYRIRIYNVSDRVIKLERKSKWNEYVMKESADLTREQVERLLNGEIDWLGSSGHPLMSDFYRDLKHEVMRPSVIVDYTREAYVDELTNSRITLDKGLAAAFHAVDLFDPELPVWDVIEGPRTILEVKYDRFIPSNIRALLQLSAHNRSTISKYVLCKERQKVYSY
ncbi:polyphosphate polymerase domain-containing protein [Brevibacillus humidisoli]|uniref:polyphosphate polymerase domain-containing protein n=1 Tax=Brevibacillus humidisoli TaxID=2895522 RepID=UPI001E440BF6|nr:polyphosphate polymerase domain-containing protein [Brevibacillus humidisoli]UFJ41052.1 polyphosphate polymerase domain-containing protein [Brevibacillus humidisoli]